MPLIPWQPWGWWGRFFEEEWPEMPEIWEWPERLLPKVPQVPLMKTPRMDIYEDNGSVIAEVELPGVDPKNIDVEVKDNVLRVEAKAEKEKEEKGKGYYKKELSRGYFKRAVPLPVEVIEEKAEASLAEGILKVVIPKAEPLKKEKKKPIKIKVKTKTA